MLFGAADCTLFLVCDRYSAYKKLARELDGKVILQWCWAHQRRTFIDCAAGHVRLARWCEGWIERTAEIYRLNEARLAHYGPGLERRTPAFETAQSEPLKTHAPHGHWRTMDDRVLGKMNAAAATLFANPHSADHVLGWRAAAAIEAAASEVGNLFQLQSGDVLFTSGATEANAMAVKSAMRIAQATSRREILVGAADHASLRNEAERCGLELRSIALNLNGGPDPASLVNAISNVTALVSVIGVNNETGAIADLRELSAICHERGVSFHVDLAQAPLAMEIDLLDLGIDLATISAHKIYGPKGIGALLIGPSAFDVVDPIFVGAGQQGGRRGGTMATELIAGFGEACRLLSDSGVEERNRVAKIRNVFVRDLVEHVGAELVGSLENRHPGNALMRFSGHVASDLLAQLQPAIAASSQSACSSGSIKPSHVLTAMGFDRQTASECIRFSLGRFSTRDQAAFAVDAIARALCKVA